MFPEDIHTYKAVLEMYERSVVGTTIKYVERSTLFIESVTGNDVEIMLQSVFRRSGEWVCRLYNGAEAIFEPDGNVEKKTENERLTKWRYTGKVHASSLFTINHE